MIEDCTALILAGGRSTRMGFDKTSLEWNGEPLLHHVLRLMQSSFPEVLVSVRERRTALDAAQVLDPMPDGGPLAGVEGRRLRPVHHGVVTL